MGIRAQIVCIQVFGLALIAVGLVGLGVACGCMAIARALPEPKEGE